MREGGRGREEKEVKMSCAQRRYKVLTSFHDVHTSGHLVREQGQTVGRTEKKSDAERGRERQREAEREDKLAPHTRLRSDWRYFTVSRAFNQTSSF